MSYQTATKRLVDIAGALIGLAASAPLQLLAMLAIWLGDRGSPVYMASRVGRHGRPFRMAKLRSMMVGADRSGVASTATTDPRITPIGRFIRQCKLDEFAQLWNVLRGDMSLVGPRPNVGRETALYTPEERRLLSIRPGITDIASIVFADEGAILAGKVDPDLVYNQLIRPWKSRLGLLYLDHRCLALDVELLYLTVVAAFSRTRALEGVQAVLARLHAEEETLRVARRIEQLVPHPPPGAVGIITEW